MNIKRGKGAFSMYIKKLLLGSLSIGVLAGSLTGCQSKETVVQKDAKVVKLGVVGSVYEELWKPAQEKLKAEGIDLEFVQFSDYTTPNNALNSGEIDLNAFQHQIYLDTEIESYGYDIQSVGYTFIIPLNLYSEKVKSVEEIKETS